MIMRVKSIYPALIECAFTSLSERFAGTVVLREKCCKRAIKMDLFYADCIRL